MKDIYNTIKERLSNPFFGSYIISWLIFNWKITIGLIWYNSETISRYNYYSYFELIENNASYLYSLILPLITAIVYTFGFPYLRNLINSFLARRDRENETNILTISETAKISTLKYIGLQRIYNESLKEVSDLIEKEGETKEENNNLRIEIIKLKDNIKLHEINESKWKELTDPKILEGNWFVQKNLVNYTKETDIRWMIDHGRVRLAHSILVDETYIIDEYLCNPFDKTVVLILKGQNIDNRDEYITFKNLKWSIDMQSLTSNDSLSINMYRIKPENFRE